MDRSLRAAFNAAFEPSVFTRYRDKLVSQVGPFPFRLAETPFFLDAHLRAHLEDAARGIVAQLSEPARLAEMKKAIPARYDTPRMDPLPDCVQVDFAIVKGEGGELCGKVVELQAFPSLFAIETLEFDAWAEVIAEMPGMPKEYSCFFGADRARALELMRGCILGGERPEDVVLVDIDPENQKTVPDFHATRLLFGVDTVCVTKLVKDGRRLLREKDGKLVPVKRIYNRMVFDELERKRVAMPFDWRDDLDVTWCSHPNWYWVWSKHSLPYLDHPAIPKARFLSEVTELPADLENYVLKPLFSFAGSGVIVDVTKEAVDAVPAEQRPRYLLQEKVEYAWAIAAPDGAGVKVEVRMMVLRGGAGQPLVPLLPLVRLSRGKMLGVDQNKTAETLWTGGSVGMWAVR
jgi:hypothetical protein